MINNNIFRDWFFFLLRFISSSGKVVAGWKRKLEIMLIRKFSKAWLKTLRKLKNAKMSKAKNIWLSWKQKMYWPLWYYLTLVLWNPSGPSWTPKWSMQGWFEGTLVKNGLTGSLHGTNLYISLYTTSLDQTNLNLQTGLRHLTIFLLVSMEHIPYTSFVCCSNWIRFFLRGCT